MLSLQRREEALVRAYVTELFFLEAAEVSLADPTDHEGDWVFDMERDHGTKPYKPWYRDSGQDPKPYRSPSFKEDLGFVGSVT